MTNLSMRYRFRPTANQRPSEHLITQRLKCCTWSANQISQIQLKENEIAGDRCHAVQQSKAGISLAGPSRSWGGPPAL